MAQLWFQWLVVVMLLPASAGAVEVLPSSDGGFLTAWHVSRPLGFKSGEALLQAGVVELPHP